MKPQLKQRWSKGAHAGPIDFVGFTGHANFGGASSCCGSDRLFWELQTGNSITNAKGVAFPGPARNQTFQSGDRIYEVVPWGGNLLLRDKKQSLSEALKFSGFAGVPLAMAIHFNKQLFICGGMDKKIVVWGLDTKLLSTTACPVMVTALAIAPDADSLLIGGREQSGISSVLCYDLKL